MEIYDPGVPLTLHPRLYTVALSGLSSQASICFFESTIRSIIFRTRRPCLPPPVPPQLSVTASGMRHFVARLIISRGYAALTPGCNIARLQRAGGMRHFGAHLIISRSYASLTPSCDMTRLQRANCIFLQTHLTTSTLHTAIMAY